MKATIAAARLALETGESTSRELVQNCIDRAVEVSGEGARTFVRVFAESAIAEADAIDRRRQAGIWTGPLGGIPISVKDLFDIRGIPTTAGSILLGEAAPATDDAVAVARLRAAGAVIVGRTNMTEFAFSGLGLNPHFGTPANPYERSTRRIPGGSSSGAAISVSDDMALAAIGTDTGGSVRIPAALCGLTGFKPTASRIPLAGTLPLSPSLDSIGPIARSVKCCRILNAVLSENFCEAPPVSLQDMRIAVPATRVFDDIDPHVSQTFEAAVAILVDAGARISRIAVPEFADIGEIAGIATFPAAEGYSWHRNLLERSRDQYDPRVAKRLEKGRNISAADYLWLLRRRKELMRAVRSSASRFDVLAMPTVPIIAPPIEELDRDDDRYGRVNQLVLRNPSLINFLDGCAISLPCHGNGDAPVGLMFARFDGADDYLLAAGEAAERALAEKSGWKD